MLAYQDFGSLLLLILGLAFLLVWQGERQNAAAGYWGAAHLALALATLTGYRYQVQNHASLGLASLICTGIFLITLYAGNRSLLGARTTLRDLFLGATLITVLVGVVGFGFDQLAGRLLVLSLMILLFAWSGWYFWSRLGMHRVSATFFFRVASLSTMFTQGERLATSSQDAWIVVVNWASSLLLAFILILVAVRQSGLRIKQILKHLPDAVVARRLDGTVLFCNERFAQLAGASSPEQLAGRQVPLLAVEGDQANRILKEINAVAREGMMHKPVLIERPIRDAAGHVFTAEIIYSNYLEFGMTVVVAQVRDISERKRAEAERVRLLSTDPLTGLLNRQGLEMEFNGLLRKSTGDDLVTTVMVLDVHRFKRFNDALGPERGDELLRSISEILKGLELTGHLVSRTGGDEFILVLTGLPREGAHAVIERHAQGLLRSIKREVRSGDISILVQANIGVSVANNVSQGPATLVQQAQLALQGAKSDGPSEYRFYESAMDTRLLHSIRIESALREAIALDELALHYQPIVDAKTGRLVKVEALIRWQSSTLGPVSPAVFIPVAEQSQLIIELGRWILNEACRQAAEWANQVSTPPIIGVNISVRQFGYRGFEQELTEIVARHGLSPEALDLELTESLFVDHQDDAMQSLLRRLAAAGFGLSLDDFGTGYSSLGYLARFPLTAVKIDRSFVRGMDTDARQRSIVRAIVSMGHNLGLRVVAEGVETETERNCLQEDSCDFLQGYLLGRPIPPGQIELQSNYQIE